MAALDDANRLLVLQATGLLDTPPEENFDRLTRLASRILRVPVSLISLVGADRQFFKSQVGLPAPYDTARETPLTHSFCQHVVTNENILSVSDAKADPRLRDNLAVRDLGVVAYLGVPCLCPMEASSARCVPSTERIASGSQRCSACAARVGFACRFL